MIIYFHIAIFTQKRDLHLESLYEKVQIAFFQGFLKKKNKNKKKQKSSISCCIIFFLYIFFFLFKLIMSSFASSIEGTFAHDFVDFMNEAVSPFHATKAASERLVAAGFKQISERSAWNLQRGGKYFFKRNDTCLVAFKVGKNFKNIFTIAGAHTDSPCLRVKPVACITKSNTLMFNTQPYGGGLWHTWFDRDLGIAGRVVLRASSDDLSVGIETKLFHINRPIARIPTLAIHLSTPSEREAFAPNLQEHAKAIFSLDKEFMNTSKDINKNCSERIHPGLLAMIAKEINVDVALIEDVEIQLVDIQPSCLGGACDEFIYSGRLDNLCSSYQSLRALIDASDEKSNEKQEENTQMIFLFDHEEIGSSSSVGAGSSIFMNTIQRILEELADNSASTLMAALRNSFVVSADMAHGLHPNYPAKHDASMAPVFNQGMVIKHNCNQRYATNSLSATLFRLIGKKMNVPVQEFTVRSDSACGSTIGPIISTLSGILTVDVGTPQFSMHSIREMMGSLDAYNGYQHIKGTFLYHPEIAESLAKLEG